MAPFMSRSLSSSKPTTLQHFTHPIHPLQLLHIPHEFLCNGCSALGFGTRYRCEKCDFDIHEHCATCPITTPSPLHPHHPLTLVNQLGNDKFCDLCGDLVHGLFYTCRACEFDVHPLCTQLPSHVQLPSHPHHLLNLQSATPAGCARCFKTCTFWRYKCDICNFDIHLECALVEVETDKVSQNIPTCQTRTIVPPTQPPPYIGGFTPGIPVGLGGHGPHGMPGDHVSQKIPTCQTHTIVPPPLGGFTPGIPVGLGGHGPHGMPGGIMINQTYSNSIGNGYGPHGMPGIMSQPYSNGIGDYGPHGNMPLGIMSQPYYCNWNGYGPDEMNQPNKIQVAGQTSNGKKKRKIYSMVGRLAASAVISSVTGFPIRF